MSTLPGVPNDVLDQKICAESLQAYLQALDSASRQDGAWADVAGIGVLLQSCGFSTIRQVHQAATDGWDRLCAFEKNRGASLSSGSAVLYALMIGSHRVRRLIATDQDRQELAPYCGD
ncbi:MAG: hypothetical protein GXY33_10520 [Phycisphaerae bacterium]|nr:hypothetical protein [Phycisphaerae bacterium]